eukprot:GHVU01042211.1.p1 GENE.GHVU01042211.1~~GHVU01042211.1.p1  ORF type:complete len:410 (+),score=98.69 GHVU01042211.1:1093-2322(+)
MSRLSAPKPRASTSSAPGDGGDTGGTEESIRVVIRQRPLFSKEKDAGHNRAWSLTENGLLTLDVEPTDPALKGIKRQYAFDSCFDESNSNEVVFEKTAKDIVLDTSKGINGCYMAYGQTGCGKTHSIMGNASDPGILPRSLAELFDVIGGKSDDTDEIKSDSGEEAPNVEYLMRITYVEIYLERVNDLIGDGPGGPGTLNENLDVKEDPIKGFFVQGLHQATVGSMQEVMQLLENAEKRRHIAATNFNEVSSRSHTVFSIILESATTYADGGSVSRRGELKLVDLAGNERAGAAAEGVEGARERQQEGQAINKSLFLLSEVISKLSKRGDMIKKGASAAALAKQQKDMMFIPWRDSKLTRLLQVRTHVCDYLESETETHWPYMYAGGVTARVMYVSVRACAHALMNLHR